MRTNDQNVTSLRRTNVVLAALHLFQAVAMVALSNGRHLPVTAAFGNGPPGQPNGPLKLEQLFTYRIGWGVATFLALSALFHAIVASPWGYARYQRELSDARNRFRWVEYSLSASLMIVLIAGIVGITDVAALLAIFGVNASMILFGWLMETTSHPGPGAVWTPFVFGCFAGVIPWVAVLIYLMGAGGNVPKFVYGIFVSIFIFFNCFAVVQWKQYRAQGKWADYLHGERAYMVLSLVAKSLLAWQVFANVLT
jgi:Heliorhodopsin